MLFAYSAGVVALHIIDGLCSVAHDRAKVQGHAAKAAWDRGWSTAGKADRSPRHWRRQHALLMALRAGDGPVFPNRNARRVPYFAVFSREHVSFLYWNAFTVTESGPTVDQEHTVDACATLTHDCGLPFTQNGTTGRGPDRDRGVNRVH